MPTYHVPDGDDEDVDVEIFYADDESFAAIKKINSLDDDPFANDAKEYYDSMNRSKKRAITKYHRGQDGAGTKKVEVEQLRGYDLYGVVEPPYNLDHLAKLYETCAPNKAAVDAKTANIVGLGYTWRESHKTEEKMAKLLDEADEREDGIDRLERARRKLDRIKHSLGEWVESLNEEDTFSEIMSKVWKDVESTGNGYLEIGRTNAGEVGYVGHIPSSTMRVRANRDGFVQIVQNKVVFFRNCGDQETKNPLTKDSKPNEILHFKKYSPKNSYYGVPDVMAALEAVAGNKFAAAYNLDYFENKAVPRYALIIKGGKLTQAAEQNLVEFFKTGVKGKHHGTLYIPVPATQNNTKVEVELVPIEAGIQEGSFTNYYMQNTKTIFMAHRVPPTKAGVSEDTNLAVAREADKMFKEQVCRPEQDRIEKYINKIISEKTDVYLFELNEMTLTDEETQARIDDIYWQIGAINSNEIRERQGRKPYEGGDEFHHILQGKLSHHQEAAEQQSQRTRGRQREKDSARGPDNTGRSRRTKGSRQDEVGE